MRWRIEAEMLWADASPMYRKPMPPGLNNRDRIAWARAREAASQLHDALFPED